LYERAVGFYGFLVNINSYHQPGVEAGKKAAAAILELQRKVVDLLKQEGTPLPVAAIADKINAPNEVEAIYKIVRHLAANDQSVKLHGNLAQPGSLTVSL
jgi:glucose-6-phosphate isomerase